MYLEVKCANLEMKHLGYRKHSNAPSPQGNIEISDDLKLARACYIHRDPIGLAPAT